MLYKEITQKVIDAAHAVHVTLGAGFSRDLYIRALSLELQATPVNFIADSEQPIFYRNEIIGSAKVELLVEEKVLVHITDQNEIPPSAYTEARCVMQTRDIPLALILGFGSARLDIRRVELPAKQRKDSTTTGKIE